MLRTSTGMQSLYAFDGTGDPAVLVTSDGGILLATGALIAVSAGTGFALATAEGGYAFAAVGVCGL